MDLKTYRSNSMAGALAEVKKDLGPDAVILRTRNYKAGGVMGFGGDTVVEITAARETPAGIPQQPRKARPAQSASIPQAGASQAASPLNAGTTQDALAELLQSVKKKQASESATTPARAASLRATIQKNGRHATTPTQLPEVADFTEPKPPAASAHRGAEALDSIDAAAPQSSTSQHAASQIPSTPVRFQPQDARTYDALESELASIRELVSSVLRTTRQTHIKVEGAGAFASSAVSPNDPLFSLYGSLCDSGVPTDLADEIVGKVRTDLDASEAREPAVIRESAVRTIASMIPIAEPQGDESRVQTLIGPTGVGKTTTIAKLAATYKLRHGKSVGLITADTYRIAAVDQLRTYAGIIGIPLEVVLDPSDIPAAIEKQSVHDVVLVDTPGRSPRDSARLEQLGAVLEAVGPSRRHLVLSAGASEPVLRSAAETFGRLAPDAMIVTKADEAGALGVLLGMLRYAKLPLSYVTTGQEVPDDLEAARAERLARAVLDGGLPG